MDNRATLLRFCVLWCRCMAATSTALRSKALAALTWTGRAALGLLYPPTCMACGAATGEPHGLCAGCWSGLRMIERPYCERLGTPFPVDFGTALLSPAAIADP